MAEAMATSIVATLVIGASAEGAMNQKSCQQPLNHSQISQVPAKRGN